MMVMTVISMSGELCRADADQRETEEEGARGPSPVNRACGAILHSLRWLRPLRR
jgi:hypothetical protein